MLVARHGFPPQWYFLLVGRPLAQGIRLAGLFDLDDLRTKIAEQGADEGAGQHRSQFEHADVPQR